MTSQPSGHDEAVTGPPGGPRPGMTGADLVAAMSNGDVLFVTIPDLEAVTGLSRMTIYRRVHDGSLEACRYGRCIRVPVLAARDFMNNGTQAAAGGSFGCRE